jgi:lysozyme
MAQRDMERIAIEDRMRTMADGAEKEELQATIDRMNMQDAVMRSFASFADPAKIGVEHATAIFESLAAGGDTMSEAIAKMAMMGFDVNAVSKEVLSFSGTAEEGTVLIADAMKDYQIAQDDFIARSGVMATNFGSVSQEYLVSVAGIVSASQNFATEIRRITREDLAKALQVTPDSDNLINLKNQTEELTRKFQELSSLIQTKLIDPLAGFAASGFETLNFLIDKIANPFRPEEEQQNSNQPSMMGATALTGGAAVGLGLGYVGMRTIANTYNALRKIGSPASGPTPTPTPTTAPPVTPSGTSNSPTTRVKNARGIWQTVPNSNYVPPAAPTPSPATGSSRGVPAPPGSSGGQTSRWTRFVSFVGTKSPRLLARLGPRLAAMAGMMAIPGPGWIAALISFGLNLTLAWELYNLWKEFSGSSDDTVEDSLNENSIPVTSMGSATNELAQSLAQLTGTDTEVGTIPTLTNSFDDLISTTDVLIEAFGSLRTSINSNNVSTASTTPRSFDSGTSGTNMQTASITPRATTRSFDSGTNISEQETKDFIIGNEGTRYEPYKDTLGNWTVGVGHLIGNDLPPEMNRRFSHQEVMDLFDSDYMHHRNAAERIPGFNRMDGLGQTALTDLTFNMGPSWINGWPNLANQLGEGDIPSAADNLRNSRWYDQVGNRGPRVANMIEDSTMLSAAQGGIASGPETGYLGKLHGTELIQPINSESVLSKLATTPESASDANINSNEIQTRMSEMYRSNMMLVETLNSKLDSMISKLEDGNYIQERILSNTV